MESKSKKSEAELLEMELAKLSCKVWKSRTPRDCDDCYGPPDCPMRLNEHGIEPEEVS